MAGYPFLCQTLDINPVSGCPSASPSTHSASLQAVLFCLKPWTSNSLVLSAVILLSHVCPARHGSCVLIARLALSGSCATHRPFLLLLDRVKVGVQSALPEP